MQMKTNLKTDYSVISVYFNQIWTIKNFKNQCQKKSVSKCFSDKKTIEIFTSLNSLNRLGGR